MLARFALKQIFSHMMKRAPLYDLRLSFADGSHVDFFTKGVEPEVEIIFKSTAAERHSAVQFYAGLFDAYVEREVDILGDAAVTKIAEIGRASIKNKSGSVLVDRLLGANPIIKIKQILQEARQDNRDKLQAKANAIHHYSLDPAFFEILLGDTVGYSEGYWPSGTKTLNEAKRNNYDYIARKMSIRPGQKVVEVGSGWGYMPMLMADAFGAAVTVYNPVPRQNEYMRARFERNGFGGRIRILEKDHRDIAEEPETYDRYVSIGVYEHAGKDGYDSWIGSIATALKPGGIGVISTTGFLTKTLTEYLTLKYIFPGGHLPSLPLTLETMNSQGLTLLDVECLRPHYQRTVAEWLTRLERRWNEIQAIDPGKFDERFRRIWTMYLAGTTQVFGTSLDLYHIVFMKGRDESAYPITRDIVREGFEIVRDDHIEYYR